MTPREPDPDEAYRENSREFLESHLLSEIDPQQIIKTLQAMDRAHFRIRCACVIFPMDAKRFHRR